MALAAFPLLVAATIVVVVIFRRELWAIFSTPDRIQAAVEGWGIVAPIGFVFLQFVQVVVFVIPGEVPQIAGGYLFGMWKGTLLSIAGIAAGSAVNFYAARILGIPFVRSLFAERQIRKFDSIAHSTRAQIAFFLLFVIPGIPKDVLCYVAGLSPLRFPAFLLISAVGRLPGIIGSAGVGDAASSKRWVLAASILAVACVLFVLGLIFRERLHTFIERFALRPSQESFGDEPADDRNRRPHRSE